jgi:galactose mutarotase-like enzyme
VGVQAYPLKQHGFARDSEFTLSAVSPTSVTYTLTDSEATRKVYPFSFRLDVSYTLCGGGLTVGHKVTNTGSGDLWFQLGAHPAFLCPLDQGFALDQYTLRFDRVQTLRRRFLNPSTGLVDEREAVVLDNTDTLALTAETFDDGALIFDRLEGDAVTLAAPGGRRSVTVRFPGWPMLGIWAPPGAPFVCIEPWIGRADNDGFAGDIGEKVSVQKLPAGECFEAAYEIEVK